MKASRAGRGPRRAGATWIARAALAAIASRAVIVAVLAVATAGCPKGDEARPGATPPPAGPSENATVSLLFPGPDGYLHAESREVALPLAADGRVAAVVAALLAGPRKAGLVAPLPAGVTVADAFVDAQGVAYVDLAAKDQPSPPASGSTLELLRVYSLVDSVLANEPRARSVVLLWNGVQRVTFAGHVDTTAPLLEDRKWVK
jgi:sporulation and spore germination protein